MAKAAPYPGPERRIAKPSPAMIGLAAFGLMAIAFVTLCPIGLRPSLGDANLERFVAYLGLGGLFALAAGRRVLAATVAVIVFALALEAAQRLAPGRHAVPAEAILKALGGVVGVTGAQLRWPLRRLAARLGLAPARAAA
ncbi:MAG: VanZ family protein [Proteobacteria bacterium]|nr:VanZ family protein [Pseudomonadota bacterium]